MRGSLRVLLAVVSLVLVPGMAYAQASITGVARDTSGAVLPGVTVEAASPVLIEKVRTAVTDGNGQYQITELRPGAYTVTFTLPGFSTVKRDGITLAGSVIAAVDADMRVGALEETITVTGEAPVVDVQSTTRQQVMDNTIINTLPTGRNYQRLRPRPRRRPQCVERRGGPAGVPSDLPVDRSREPGAESFPAEATSSGGSYAHNGPRRWQTHGDPEWQMLGWVRGERTGRSCS